MKSTYKNDYENGITEGQYKDVLNTMVGCTGKGMSSGYRSDLYDRWLINWNRHDFDLPNNAASGSSKRRMTECVWTNF